MNNQYPTTGYTPILLRRCIRCEQPNGDLLYKSCENCRDADLLIPAAKAINAEMFAVNPECKHAETFTDTIGGRTSFIEGEPFDSLREVIVCKACGKIL